MIIGPPASSSAPAPGSRGPDYVRAFADLRGESMAQGAGYMEPSSLEPAIHIPRGVDNVRLKPHQRSELGRLAKAAYQKAKANGGTRGLSEEAWRHDEARKAAGVRISEACQRHYNDLESHFARLAGETGRAFGVEMRKETSDNRIALFKLRQQLAAQGLQESYAVAIAKAKFKETNLTKLSVKQTWVLVYDVRRAGGSQEGKQRKAAIKAKGEEQRAKGQGQQQRGGRDYVLRVGAKAQAAKKATTEDTDHTEGDPF